MVEAGRWESDGHVMWAVGGRSQPHFDSDPVAEAECHHEKWSTKSGLTMVA